MGRVINPRYIDAYTFQVDFSDNIIVKVVFKIPTELKQDQLKIQYSKKLNAVNVFIPGEIPFLRGKFCAPITDFKYSFTPGEITLTMNKAEPQEWQFLIAQPYKSKEDDWILDPQSALILFIVYTQIQPEIGVQYLEMSFSTNYPPAIVTYARTMEQNPENYQKLVPKLKSVVDDYKFSQGGVIIGSAMYMNFLDTKIGYEYLKKAVEIDENNQEATELLGIMLSPLEEPHGDFENVEECLRLLNKVTDHPRAQYTLSRHYAQGLGLPKDLVKARELMEVAQKEFPNLEVIPELANENVETKSSENDNQNKEGSNIKATIIAAIGTVAVVAAATGLGLYKIFKKK